MENDKPNLSEEMTAIFKAIRALETKHKGHCQFVCSFVIFDDKFNVTDESRRLCFGAKETVLLDLEDLLKGINKEKDEFVNW